MTKAQTLEFLASKIKHARVLPIVRIRYEDWRSQSEAEIKRVLETLGNAPLIVRSTYSGEDKSQDSLAGKFTTIPNVSKSHCGDAIERVFASYPQPPWSEEVFVQPMLQSVSVSGVLFTRDPNTGSYYWVINYDDRTGRTDTVTSGTTSDLKAYYAFEGKKLPERLECLRPLVDELESIYSGIPLDIEFAMDGEGVLYVLQVRPLQVAELTVSKERCELAMRGIENKIRQSQIHPYLYGGRAVYGVMPDWYPAEMIGLRPRPLALSLYKEAITDNIWAYQRSNYGYKNLRSFPLLIDFAGLPYIDVRVSFNSFVPKDIDDELSTKLVNFYIEKLEASPGHHDKVEFEIVYSCYCFDLLERMKPLKRAGFSNKECDALTQSLRSLTNRIIHGESGLWRQDREKIDQLESRIQIILGSGLPPVSQIYWLLEDCKRYGTLPFAGLARAAFIAVQLLKSLVSSGALTDAEYEDFMRNLNTVGSGLSADFATMDQETFLKKYGHLRPGTYDILSPSYRDAPNRYFNWKQKPSAHAKQTGPFSLSLTQLRKIEDLLKDHALDYSALGLLEFIKSAIEGREYAKFVFTKSISEVLTLVSQLGREMGLTDLDCAYLDIDVIRKLHHSSEAIHPKFLQSIQEGKEKYELTKHLLLPPLITEPEQVMGFHLPSTKPNFVTLKSTSGRVVFAGDSKQNLKDSILFIPSADPGYDWILSHGIAGFVTMYGGVNSHMAIRAQELGIPAVIGAGQQFFGEWSEAEILELDCLTKQVRFIR